jgi:hypothetical protein
VVPPASSPCAALTTCCGTLDEDDQEDCQEVADEADFDACRTSLRELCPNVTTTTTPSSSPCADLLTCCDTLEEDADIDACRTTAVGADPVACQDANTTLCEAAGDDD